MIIGNYMLLNLFLAILLKFISENSESANPQDAEADNAASSIKNAPETSTIPNDGIKDVDDKSDMNRSQSKQLRSSKGDQFNDGPEGINMSGRLNSSNSNIEEEFEHIKEKLQQMSNVNLAAS